jgi:hypothetical protein
MDNQDNEQPQVKTGTWHYIAFALYLPLIGVLIPLIGTCLWLLVHGRPAGTYGLLYALVLYVLARRALGVLRGGRTAGSLWPDIAALLPADALLAVVGVSWFS